MVENVGLLQGRFKSKISLKKSSSTSHIAFKGWWYGYITGKSGYVACRIDLATARGWRVFGLIYTGHFSDNFIEYFYEILRSTSHCLFFDEMTLNKMV